MIQLWGLEVRDCPLDSQAGLDVKGSPVVASVRRRILRVVPVYLPAVGGRKQNLAGDVLVVRSG